jgi:hypothetical protein
VPSAVIRINTPWSVRMEKYETPDLPAKLTWLSLWENMQVAKNKQAIAVQNRFIVLKNKVKGLGVSMRSCCEKR